MNEKRKRPGEVPVPHGEQEPIAAKVNFYCDGEHVATEDVTIRPELDEALDLYWGRGPKAYSPEIKQHGATMLREEQEFVDRFLGLPVPVGRFQEVPVPDVVHETNAELPMDEEIECPGFEHPLPAWPGWMLHSFELTELRHTPDNARVVLVATKGVGGGQLVTSDDVRSLTDHERALKAEIEHLKRRVANADALLVEASATYDFCRLFVHSPRRLAFRTALTLCLALIACMVARDWQMIAALWSALTL